MANDLTLEVRPRLAADENCTLFFSASLWVTKW
jgi:hypothetical protein